MSNRFIVPDKSVMAGANNTGSTIARYVAVDIDGSGGQDPVDVVLPTVSKKIFGINISGGVDTTGEYGLKDGVVGDIQTSGMCKVLVGAGGVTVGDELSITAAGAVVTAASTHVVIGHAMTTTAAAGYADVMLAGIQSYVKA